MLMKRFSGRDEKRRRIVCARQPGRGGVAVVDAGARSVGGGSTRYFPNYAAGSWGLEAAQRLLDHGHSWPRPIELMGLGKNKRRTRDSTTRAIRQDPGYSD